MQNRSSLSSRSLQEERGFATLVELLKRRAAGHAAAAYTYLVDGETQAVRLSYQELDRQARAIAAKLQTVAGVGSHAILLYPPGLDFIAAFFGCLYAGVVAIPAYPPDPARLNRSLPRLHAIIKDSRAVAMLTTTSLLSAAKPLLARAEDLRRLQWVTSDDLITGDPEAFREQQIQAESVAFLQYTSGSTGMPKGVILTHRNLLHNAALVYHAFDHGEAERYVSWLPTFHDMGFMAGVLQPLFGGFEVVLLSPLAFLQKPIRWLKALTRYKGTTSGGPNFAYDLCVRKITADERASLDLSNWRIAFNGAEPVRHDSLEGFARAFASCGFQREAFYPCYGLAEATLIVSGGQKERPPVIKRFKAAELENHRVFEAPATSNEARVLVGCGATLPGQTILCVNPVSLRRCQAGEVGEIWVSGESVARGYWNQAKDTEERFQGHTSDTGEGPFLRTGDLGFLLDGELFITGRIKDLIIIRGLNHYPQDIEASVEHCHKALRPGCAAAFSLEVDGEERLAVVQEVEPTPQGDYQEVIDAIRQVVADTHELQVYGVALVKPGTIPKTSSGKIQRHACRIGFMQGGLEELARHVTEDVPVPVASESFIRQALLAVEATRRASLVAAYLIERLAKLMGVAASRIDSRQPLTAYGLDSLKAIELNHQIETELGVRLSLASLLAGHTVSDLAVQLADEMPLPGPDAWLAEPGGEALTSVCPLSYGQQALWFLHLLAPESAAYNVSFAGHLGSSVDVSALGRAFQCLVDRHAALRTTISLLDGQPVQIIHRHMGVDFSAADCSAVSEAALNQQLLEAGHEPFDLEEGPLLRVRLLMRSGKAHVLLLTAHHIVFDGWSLWVLLDELAALYAAETGGEAANLPPVALQYADYVRWQAAMLKGAAGEQLWAYWQSQLSGDWPLLDLPSSRPRPPVMAFEGASQYLELDESLLTRLRRIANTHGATPYMVLLAAFLTLLYRYTNQRDLVVGSPVSSRSRAGLEQLVGCFFNVVAIRADMSGNPTFLDLLAQVRERVLGALDHQDFPSHLLAERLQLPRDPSRPRLFPVTFILQKPYGGQSSRLAEKLHNSATSVDLALQYYPLAKKSARADLELELVELGDSVTGFFHYNTDLFDSDAMTRMGIHYQNLLACIATDPLQRITDLAMLTDAEQQLLHDWARTGRDYSQPVRVHELFEEQAAKTPAALAAVGDQRSLTYQSLNERADQLARLIRRIQQCS